MRSLLLSLPDAVVRTIFLQWLSLKNIVILDTVCCNGEYRPQFLDVAYASVGVVYLKSEHVVNIIHRSTWISDVFSKWIHARGAAIGTLYLTAYLLENSAALNDVLKRSKDAITAVAYGGNPTGVGMEHYHAVTTKIADMCANVQMLSTIGIADDAILDSFSATYPNLRECRLHGVTCVTGDAVRRLVEKCPQLTHVYLEAVSIKEEFLQVVAQHCPHLEVLQYNEAFRDVVSKDTWLAVSQHCPKMRKIKMEAKYVDDATLVALAQCCPLLESVDLRNCSVTEAAVVSFYGALPHMGQLIPPKHIGDDALMRIVAAGCPNLRECRLHRATNITGDAVRRLVEKCPKLTHVYLEAVNIKEEVLQVVAQHCPHLEVLEYSNKVFRDVVSKDTWLAVAQYCPKMRRLNMEAKYVDDATLVALAQCCPLLESVDLRNCSVTEAAVVSFYGALPHMGQLIPPKHIGDDALISIVTNCPALRTIFGLPRRVDDVLEQRIAERFPNIVIIL